MYTNWNGYIPFGFRHLEILKRQMLLSLRFNFTQVGTQFQTYISHSPNPQVTFEHFFDY